MKAFVPHLDTRSTVLPEEEGVLEVRKEGERVVGLVEGVEEEGRVDSWIEGWPLGDKGFWAGLFDGDEVVGLVEGVRSELGVVVGCTLERVVVTVVPQPQPLPEGNIPQLQQQWYPFCSTQPGTMGCSGTDEDLHCHAKVPQEAKTVPPPIVEVVEGRVVEAGAILVVGAAEREKVGLKD